MANKVYTFKIAGPAGLGIKSIGQLFSKILIAHGFNLADYSEYPSLVRGGHNTYQISFSLDKVFAPHYQINAFFAINPGHWQQHQSEFNSKTLIFSDEENPESGRMEKGIFYNLPLKTLANEIGSPLVVNTISLGVAVYLLGFDLNLTKEIVCGFYQKFSDLNSRAIQAGYDYAQTNFPKCKLDLKTKINPKTDQQLYEGNESYGWGFLAGGGNFYAAYPMTPATGALHFLAAKQEAFPNIKVIHAEDEVGVANMGAGAAFAGARAAVGTSGGGFALMNEAVSYCGVAEIGLVYYLVSRPGPATGLPTWTAQGDLMHAIYSGHGEFPKVVMAPGDIDESFEMGYQSLNLAAKLQTPIIVVSDKFLGESSASTNNLSKIKVKIETGDIETKPSQNYARYKFTPNGISPLTIPGTPNGQFLANSYEHDELGFSTEDAQVSQKMFDKRMAKNKLAIKLAPKANLFGNNTAKTLIISWGSTKGPILEALKDLPNKDDFAFLQIKTLWPINPDIKNIINGFSNTVVIENNGTGQLVTLLKSQFDFNPTKIHLRNDGRPFFPEEIIKLLK
ncbi:MAG: 2-oxoacid:acceptor oxidoreductase subunit alpha [Candidatus Shapirobacteria bacterium]|nr:2-oxoacid:acceptor oxidoreductase subunit alpha [Candidatus Shapirobacteria bacterium]